MVNLKRLLAMAIIILGFNLAASAIGAYPYPIMVKQPDGTSLLIRIQGDENFHYVTTSDGYLVEQDERGFYCYVDYNFLTGTKTLTPQQAHNMAERTDAERKMLTKQMAATTINADILKRNIIERKTPAKTLDRKIISPLRKVGAPQQAPESQYVVILVSFADSIFRNTNADFDKWLNQPGYSDKGGTGSVKDYYRDNSMGRFIPNFHVLGPYQLAHELAYYARNTGNTSASDVNPRAMVKEACQLAKADHPELNFSQFDNDHDGMIDNCYVIYAGYSEASSGRADDMWPHAWRMGEEQFQIDGVTVNNYSCSAELVGRPGAPATPSMDGIGTFTHEFGHVLGLKDMYDTDGYTNGRGLNPGGYNLYASGNYNNGGHTPPYLMAFERMQMGWMTEGVDILELNNPEDVQLEHIAANKARFINAQPGRAAGTGYEWFILENRQQAGWDKYIPAHGLMITHYDYTKDMQDQYWSINGPNNNARHRCMYIVPADNVDDDNSRPGDTYPGLSGNTEFTPTSRPAAKNWAGQLLSVSVTNITEGDGKINFQANGGQSVWNVIKTGIPENLRDVSATFKAEISAGAATVDEAGFCWKMGSDEPTLADASGRASNIAAPSLDVSDLEPGSNYNVRAYMKLADGRTVYGSSMPFTTECRTVATPYEANFTSWTNGQPDCWKIVDRNGDGTTWIADETSNSIVYSFDYWNNADDWLISRRRIHVPNNGVLFFTRGVSEQAAIENLEIYVSNKSSDINDFHLQERFSFADHFNQQHIEEVDLSKFAGQDIYIAFRCCSDKMQGDLWMWNLIVTEKLQTPVITNFSRKDEDHLNVTWTPMPGTTGYYLYFGRETNRVNQQIVFTPMSFYEDVKGDVTLGTGNIYFKSDGSVTLKTFPDGIADCRFLVTTSGPTGTSELTVEGTRDGSQWQTVGRKIILNKYDSEGQECNWEEFLRDKGFIKLRFTFKNGGRNGRIKYLTLIYNDGYQYETLAAGGVNATFADIRSKTPGEFNQGKYMAWVASGYRGLFFDESEKAYYSFATPVEHAFAESGITIESGNGAIRLGGLKSGQKVNLTSLSGLVLFSGTATHGEMNIATHGVRGVAIIQVTGDGQTHRTKTVIR